MGVLEHLRRLVGAIIAAVVRRKTRDGRDDESGRRTSLSAPRPLSPSLVEAANDDEGESRVAVPPVPIIDPPIDLADAPEPNVETHQFSAEFATATVPSVDGLSNERPGPIGSSDGPHLVVAAQAFGAAEEGEPPNPLSDGDSEPQFASEGGLPVRNEVADEPTLPLSQRGVNEIVLVAGDAPATGDVTELIAAGIEEGAISTPADLEPFDDAAVALADGVGSYVAPRISADESSTPETVADSGADENDLADSVIAHTGLTTELTTAGPQPDALATPAIVEHVDETVVAVTAKSLSGGVDGELLLADESSPAEAIAVCDADKIDLADSVRTRDSAAAKLISATVEKDALATPANGEEFGGTAVSPPAESVLGDGNGTLLAAETSRAEAILGFGADETEEPDLDGSTRPARKRQVPYERPPEPATEYTAGGFLSPPLEYRRWNRAIAEHLILQISTGSGVYLTITPRILARALLEVDGASLEPDLAQDHFADTVSQLYRSQILTQRGRLRVLRRVGDDGLPDCIAFLALSVLAAYRMRGDEEATGLAYYVRLAELLQCDVAGAYPVGFDPIVFESLWHFLRDWLARRRGIQLVVPAPETGHRRFVGLPLAHVPLRSLDIEKLPDFFVWAGYQPSSEVTHERLAGDFVRWVRARGALTPTGVAAFADARRGAVLAEIRAELDSWDGTCEESFGRRSAAVEILFDVVQQRPELFYVPRRPSGFPSRFDDGAHSFEASDDGWYGRVSIAPQDGEELASGFIWQAAHSGVEFALRRAGASVISLAPSDDFSYSGFMSARGLRKGVRCAVLCRDDGAQVAAEYLSHVTERPCSPIRHPDLPVGWSVFPGVLARRVAEAPAGFESIDVQARVGLIPSGGIRLGNRWTWLHGAPPRIIVTGSEPGLTVTIDGEPAIVGEDGALQSEGPLTSIGAHVIQVGPLRRTVEIMEPSLPVDSIAPHPQSSGPRAAALFALPSGSWTTVGAVPGQIARAKHGHRAGTIAETAFVPSWSIRVGPEGATVLHVSAGVPPAPVLPKGLRPGALSTHGYFSWATAIYDAAVRHPRIESLTTTDDESLAIAESWKSYARCAGQIKRQIRRFRR